MSEDQPVTFDDELLSAKIDELAERLPERRDVLDVLATFVRTADDRDLVRMNPVRFAREQGHDEAEVVEVFLHARKIGLLTMEWHYVCPGCGDIVESFQSLTSATAHYFCQICTANRDADLSSFVEITFTISTEIRESSYHDPWSLSPEEYFFSYRFTGNGVLTDVVRLHFGFLRESISRNSGALVKTIGDAVMASFHDPLDALRAALDMHARIADFNADAGDDLISLKVGAHTGTCLAVTLNGRLDYFGQTVNLAARVQGLSHGNDIVLSEEMLRVEGARELLVGYAIDTEAVELKGIHGAVRIHRVSALSGAVARSA